MENTMFSKVLDEDDPPGNNEGSTDQIFYRPLCFSGYLTPLQRKKLREKRKWVDEALENNVITKPPKIIKMSTAKRTSGHRLSVPPKITKRLKTKGKAYTPPLKCSAAKIIKTADVSGTVKKFFKSASSDRLQKAIFSMPFACKKNVSAIIERSVRQNLSRLRTKNSVTKECSDNIVELPDEHSDSEFKNSEMTSPGIDAKEICKNPLQKILFDFEWPSDELLLQRQEQARADLRRQITSKALVLEKTVNDDKQSALDDRKSPDDKIGKLYPVFYSANQKRTAVCPNSKRKQKRVKSCWGGEEQMFIDAGQKEIGAKICEVCNMIYSIGLDVDEATHHDYHNMYLKNLKFPGWKVENVVGDFLDGRVVVVRDNDPFFKLKKVEDVLAVANRDLGFPASGLPSKPDLTFILFIANVAKQVAGLVIAERISSANRVLLAEDKSSGCATPGQKKDGWRIGNWYSSADTVPAVCGISRIWVSHEYRRQKIASRMIDCLRCHFLYGHVISLQELAFTDPSPDGREFAAAYTGTDNFLVYR